MKSKAWGVLLVLVGLGLGATLLRDQVPVGDAASPPPATSPATPTPTPLTAGALLQNEQNTTDIVQLHEPGLLLITTEDQVPSQAAFGWMYETPEQVQSGVGSGFFVNDAGDILTNYHVIAGADDVTADQIQVQLFGGEKTVDAEVVGVAPMYDLALIRAKGLSRDEIHAIPLGDSDRLQVGQKAIAMGAPFGLEFSVSEGIVSAVSRQIPIGFSQQGGEGVTQRAIQTDAAINPGNSGGPLLDSGGRVIGINTQIYSPSGQTGAAQSAGVGFAIPINAAKNLLPRLQAAQGGVVSPPRIGIVPGIVVRGRSGAMAVGLGMLGTRGKRAEGLPDKGLLIGQVSPNTPAARAGLRGGNRTEDFRDGRIVLGGDVIVSADGTEVDALEDLQAVMLDKREGDQVELVIVRGGREQQVNITLDEGAF